MRVNERWHMRTMSTPAVLMATSLLGVAIAGFGFGISAQHTADRATKALNRLDVTLAQRCTVRESYDTEIHEFIAAAQSYYQSQIDESARDSGLNAKVLKALPSQLRGQLLAVQQRDLAALVAVEQTAAKVANGTVISGCNQFDATSADFHTIN